MRNLTVGHVCAALLLVGLVLGIGYVAAQEMMIGFTMVPSTIAVVESTTCDVDVVIDTPEEINFARLQLSYDPAYLAVAKVSAGDLPEVYRDLDTPGEIDFRVQATEPLSGSLSAATVTFTATTVVTETTITFDEEHTKVALYGESLAPTEILTETAVSIHEWEPPEGAALIIIDPGVEEAYPGDVFWVTTWVIDALNIVGWEGVLTYDNGIVEPTGDYVLGGLLPGAPCDGLPIPGEDCVIQSIDFEDDERIAAFQFGGIAHSGAGRLMAVKFDAVMPGTSIFAFEEAVKGYLFRIGGTVQPLLASPAPQTVKVSEHCPGDFVEPWGFIDLADIMAMVPAWNSDCGDEEYHEAMDRNDDCHIGLYDVMQVVAMWNTPCPD